MEWGPNSVKESKEFIKRTMRAAKERPRFTYDFALTERGSKEVIGAVGLMLVGFPPNQALVGYVLNRRHWGRGIMSEALKAVLAFGFDNLRLHRVSATCDQRNVASYRVMEKCGMRREGLFLEDKFIKGEWRDTLCYSLLAREWDGLELSERSK
jgi:RimJ/RimL family protein N-acetyltransferase